jgi:hypothetical protein
LAAVVPPDLLGVHVLRRIEPADLGADLAGVILGVEQADAVHAALAGEDVRPEVRHVVSQRRDHAQAGDDDAFLRRLYFHQKWAAENKKASYQAARADGRTPM